MRLSIITINYNNLEGLKRTYNSVVSQTCQDFEWIIIDGGSTDGSKEFLEVHQEKFSYWCSEPDKGIYNAMNKGIAKANGEYLQFLNSGDKFYAPDVIEKVFRKWIDADIVYGNQYLRNRKGGDVFYFPDSLTIHYFLYRSLGHPSSFIKSSLLKGDGYREDLIIVSDWEKFIKWFRRGKTFRHIDMVIADFDDSGVSNTNMDLVSKETNIIYDEIFGVENRKWIEESVEMQRLRESCENEDIRTLLGMHNHGGIQARLLHFVALLLKRILQLTVNKKQNL